MQDSREHTPEQANPLIDREGIHEDAIAAVGRCMLTRALATDFNIRGYEVKAIQALVDVAPEPVTARDISNKLQESGLAGSPRTTERTMAILRGRGILNTATKWRTTYYSIDEVVIESSEQSNVERLKKAQEIRAKIDEWAGEYFTELIRSTCASEIARKQHFYALRVLYLHAGWPIATKLLERPASTEVNMSKWMKDLAEILPDGLLQKIGTVDNKIKYQLNHPALMDLKKPEIKQAEVYVPVLSEEILDSYKYLRRAFKIRSFTAIRILALLERNGGSMTRSAVEMALEAEGFVGKKQTTVTAYQIIKSHELVAELPSDDTAKSNLLVLSPKADPRMYTKPTKVHEPRPISEYARARIDAHNRNLERIRLREQRKQDNLAAGELATAEKQRAREARIAEAAAIKAQAEAAKQERAQANATARLLAKKQATKPKLRTIVEDVPTEPLPPIADFVPKQNVKPAETVDAEPSKPMVTPRSPATKYEHVKIARDTNPEKQLDEGLQFNVIHPAADIVQIAFQIAKVQKMVPIHEVAEGIMQPAKMRQLLARVKTANGTPVFNVHGDELSLNRMFLGDRRNIRFLPKNS